MPTIDKCVNLATILAMPRPAAFEIIFDKQALAHFDAIESKFDSMIQEAIEEQLIYAPTVPTRNRKPLQRETEIGATWEIRFGPDNSFRVFYDVDVDEQVVIVLAIARKIGNQLFIGKEKFEL